MMAFTRRNYFPELFTGYSSEVDVLKNLSFETEYGEKLAIVGRIGAGKSSMVLACLRIQYKHC